MKEKLETLFQYLSGMVIIAAIPFVAYYTFTHYYPFTSSKVEAVIPTDKQTYRPGDRVGFKLNICVDSYKYDQVTFQLESDPSDGHYFFVIGTFKSISIPGCWKLTDLNAIIPSDIFTSNAIAKPGKHRIFVIISSPQNTGRAPKIYQSDWFVIE